jgi:hypothetical protein
MAFSVQFIKGVVFIHLFFCGAGDQVQVLKQVRQALYH